jgi:hypothetical protein
MARSQVLNAADNFKAIITTPAWRSKPSWMLVATKDRSISPSLERWYAARANSHKVEVTGASHSVYASRPKQVAALIEEAASHARPAAAGLRACTASAARWVWMTMCARVRTNCFTGRDGSLRSNRVVCPARRTTCSGRVWGCHAADGRRRQLLHSDNRKAGRLWWSA